MAKRLGISSASLSRIENGEWPSDFDLVCEIADAYSLTPLLAEREWLKHQATSEKGRSHLELFFNTLGQAEELPASLKNFASALSVLKDASGFWQRKVAHILDALAALEQSSKSPNKLTDRIEIVREDSFVEADWSPLMANGYLKTKRHFGTSKPCRLLIESHRVPPRMGAFHKQMKIGNVNPGLEIFSVVVGTMILAVQNGETGEWSINLLGQGNSGFYGGGNEHIWMNVSYDAPVTVFCVFFPQPQESVTSSMIPDPSPEILTDVQVRAGEFKIDRPLTALPEEIQKIVKKIRQDYPT
jgi:transcriptional regulator with XRE-family HTH domain